MKVLEGLCCFIMRMGGTEGQPGGGADISNVAELQTLWRITFLQQVILTLSL